MVIEKSGSKQYHYEKMENWPEGFVAFGDSVSAFNPFYGQGITAVAIGATILDKSVRDFKHQKHEPNMTGFARAFQKRIAKVNAFPWLLGTSEDFRWSTTQGNKPSLFIRFMQKYSYQVMLLAPESRVATKLFFEMTTKYVRASTDTFSSTISCSDDFEDYQKEFTQNIEEN